MNHTLLILGWNLGLVVPMAALAWCACQIRAVRLRPALCHGIWFLVLLKLITLPLISVSLLPAWHLFDVDVDADNTPPAAPIVTAATPGPIPTPAIVPDISTPEQNTGAPAVPTAVAASVGPVPFPFATDEPPRRESRPEQAEATSPPQPASFWRNVIVAAVASSLLATLCLWAAALRQIQRVRRLLQTSLSADIAPGENPDTTREQERHARQLLAEVARRFGTFAAVPRLAIVNEGVAPMVWADPIAPATRGGTCVILSRPLLDLLDDDQLRYVIAHELAHCVRGDHWTNAFGFCVATLFWWHPVAWFARRELGHAAEACCDALIVEKLSGSRKSYARTLLKVVDFIQSRHLPQPALALTFGGSSSLKKRFQMLTTERVESRVSHGGWGLLVLLGLASLALFPARAHEKPRPPETQTALASPDAATAPGTETSHTETADARTLALAANDASNANEAKSATTARDKAKSDKAKIDNAPANGRYYVVGSVVEEETEQPLAGAVLRFLIDGEPNPDKSLLLAVTDVQGRFQAEVPVGNLRVWFPELKPGYWLNPDDNTKALATSVDKPVVTLDLVARRGLAWPVQVTVEEGIPENTRLMVSVDEVDDDDLRAKWLKGEPVSFMTHHPSCMNTLDAAGRGAFTQCGTTGKLFINVSARPGNESFFEVGGVSAEFIADPDFDTTKVKTVTPDAATGKVELIDERGAKATISKARVTVTDGVPLITFQLPRTKHAMQEFVGRVVDSADKPLADVRVGMAMGTKGGGSAAWPTSVMTDGEGAFRFAIPLFESKQALESKHEKFVSFMFNKDGFASTDTRNISVPKKPVDAIDVGKVSLKAGRWLPVRVVDQEDRPVAGAVLEPVGSYALRRMAIRTDAEGRGILKNLPAGPLSVILMYPGQNETRKLVVSARQADNTETKLRLKTTVAQPAIAVIPRMPITVGQAAPEWDINTWTDKKPRTLAEYRGRVVVIDFWGVWCGGCVRGIPMMQDLAEKYESKGVAFLGIHTPDGDLEQIAKLKKSMGWKAETGIDRGSSVVDGASAARYGVRGFPSYIVIDAEGNVVFNSGREPEDREAFMKDVERLAKSLQIPWPPPGQPNEEQETDEAIANMNILFGAMLSREIDKTLAAGKK
jgi:beta-lactamase regulating signal transducer with metallopeptidase domain/thiol-disulfide isomerase/thioredoxin